MNQQFHIARKALRARAAAPSRDVCRQCNARRQRGSDPRRAGPSAQQEKARRHRGAARWQSLRAAQCRMVGGCAGKVIGGGGSGTGDAVTAATDRKARQDRQGQGPTGPTGPQGPPVPIARSPGPTGPQGATGLPGADSTVSPPAPNRAGPDHGAYPQQEPAGADGAGLSRHGARRIMDGAATVSTSLLFSRQDTYPIPTDTSAKHTGQPHSCAANVTNFRKPLGMRVGSLLTGGAERRARLSRYRPTR